VLFFAAIAEKMLFGTLFLSYLLTLFSLSVVLTKSESVLNSLPRAFLIISFYYEVLLIVGVHIPVFKNQSAGNLIVLIPMILCGSLAYFRIPHQSGSRSYSLALFTGPTVFISFVTFAYMKFGGVLTWAMSGDSRNHVYQIRAVMDRGGIVLFNGYPSLANGFAALWGGWQYNSNSAGGGHLGSEIHILGLTSAITLVTCSVLAGLFLGRETGKQGGYMAVAAAVVSLTPFSQVFLNTYFTEGFFPSSLCLAIVLAVVFEMTRSDSSFISRISFSILGCLLLLLTFPLLLPLLLPCFFFAFLLQLYSCDIDNSWQEQPKRKISILVILTIPVLIVEIVSRIPSVSAYVYKHLNTYGRISPIDDWGLWVLTLSAGFASFTKQRTNNLIAPLTFVIGVSSIQFTVILDRLLDASYYLNKYVWISTNIMIILNLIVVANLLYSASSVFRRLTLGFISIGSIALTSIPVLQDFPLKPNLLTLATSPEYPSVKDAHLITKVNNMSPRSIFWQVSPDFEATQVIDIWITMGFDMRDGTFGWAYNSDVFSLSSVCSFAIKNQPATIWTISEEARQLVELACVSDGIETKVIPYER
jgi:hypothetical protein